VLYDLPQKHIVGRVFLRLRDKVSLDPDGYFRSVLMLRPLFERDDFSAATPGFYINYIRDPGTPTGSLRLNYFTIDCSRTIDAIGKFGTRTDRTIFKREPCDENKPLAEYNEGEDTAELRFRNFLDANTRICLDMLENFGAHSFQSLVAAYRFIFLPQGIPPESVFQSDFINHSQTFNELRRKGLDRMFWTDLLRIHRRSDVGLHFMVNLVALMDNAYPLQFVHQS